MIKSFIRSALKYNEDKSRLELMVPVISFSLDDGSYYEDEYSYLSRINEREYYISDWHGKERRILCQNNRTKSWFEYDLSSHELGTRKIFPRCLGFYDDWYTVKVNERKLKRPPIPTYDTELRCRLTNQVYEFEYSFEINYVIGKYIYGSHKHRDRTTYAVKIDSETGGVVWQNSDILGGGERIDEERFLIHDRTAGGIQIFSLESGKLLKTIPFPSRVSGPFQYGSIRRYLSPEGWVFDYDSSIDDISEYQLFEKSAEDGSDFTYTEDFVCATNAAEHRLRVYSISEQECVFEGYLPEIGIGLGTSPVAKLGGYYSFTVNDRSRWDHGFYARTYLFTLDDLKTVSPAYDHEELKADYDRVSREDGNVDYRVFFTGTESYSVLYRHTNAIVNSLGEEYGWTKAFEGNSCDEQFTGKIIVDVSNQPLDGEQKNYLELLCIYLANELQLFYRAGMDPEQFITVTPQFD